MNSHNRTVVTALMFTLGVLALCVGTFASVVESAQGIVFHDSNGNGIRDLGEPGVGGQPVSNGYDIVLSADDGSWNLEVGHDNTLFVMPRDGWTTPINENGLPQFYYIHKPHGSPALKHPGSAPTGDLPSSIEFPLKKIKTSEQFSILLFGDPQPRSDEHIDFLARDVISEAAAVDEIAFGLSLGDIVSNDLDLFAPLNAAIGTLGHPWYNVAGNHDINFDVERDEDSDETFEAVYGPPNYAFQYGKVHFLIVDNVIYGGKTFAEKIKNGEIKNKRKYVGGLREDQFRFIENYLKLVERDELVVINGHIPLFQRLTSYYKGIESFRDGDRRRLFELLKPFPYTLSFSAHTHFQKQHFFDQSEGWMGEGEHHHVNLGTTCGDWFKGLPSFDGIPDMTMRDGTPNGYAIVEFDGNQYDIRYKVAGAPERKQMSLYVSYPWQQDEALEYLYANFYMGTEYTQAECRFDEGEEWRSMEQVYEADPRSRERYDQHQALAERLPEDLALNHRLISEPHPCSHLWKAEIPEHIEPGFHRAEVRMTDRKGKSFYETLVFRISR